jgi:L-alanine-DL-glutamate epimerase-like enolase superfamily enzyme
VTGRDATIDRVRADAYTIPTDAPESDGTLEWHETTIVVVHCDADGETGLGYTYGDASIEAFVANELRGVVEGRSVGGIGHAWHDMCAAIRNAGRPGLGMMAVSAVDIALWDLRARTLGLPLVALLPAFHDEVPVYGSGGFCSYSLERLGEQLSGWVDAGIPRVKMKLGRRPDEDPARLATARKAIGDDVELFVDANGAFRPKQALGWAQRYRAEWDVAWFEEPVSSGDVAGMRFVRDHGPAGLDIAAGEYVAVLEDAAGLLDPPAVDCLQVDVTRCGGVTGTMLVAAMAAGHGVDVSGHCAPSVSVHALCAAPTLRHLEYFHDHVRIERMLFDGAPEPTRGVLRPDPTVTGHGLTLRAADAERFRRR